jgi:hypothetical protein
MLNATKEVLDYYNSIAKSVRRGSAKELTKIKKNIQIYFPKELMIGILRVYSLIYFYGYEKLSMKDMIYAFLSQLTKTNNKRIAKINPKLIELKEILKEIPTKEELLFSKIVYIK